MSSSIVAQAHSVLSMFSGLVRSLNRYAQDRKYSLTRYKIHPSTDVTASGDALPVTPPREMPRPTPKKC